MTTTSTPDLILASSSPYRRELLQRLRLEFRCISPDIDESALPNENADELAERLARQKAAAIAVDHQQSIIIGSDQVAEVNGQILGKPHTAERAVEQLLLSAGHTVTFHTGLCIQRGEQIHSTVVPYAVEFRSFDRATAERYVAVEQPLNCAGSFKSEGLGISLFQRQYGDDPTSLIGLPLIKTCEFLRELGLQIP